MKTLAALLLAGLCALPAQAQRRHDPLNEREVDQLREYAQDPMKRIDLLIEYTKARMLAVDRMRTSAKPDAERLGDLLSDFTALVDELDSNLEMYNNHSEDLRRPLRHVLEAEAEFDKSLQALDAGATPLQKRAFAAALEDAQEAVKSSTENAKAMLADQIAKKGEEKNKEKLDKQEAKEKKRSEE